MIYLPTFVRGPLDQLESKRASTDASDKYKSLETVYAATIKYIGTTAALVARQYCTDREQEQVWSAILDSSSLGGWLNAMDTLCSFSASLPTEVKRYCAELNDYQKHPARPVLKEIAGNVDAALATLNNKGYNIELLPKKPSMLRSLERIVAIRNKNAHGYLDSHVLHEIQNPLSRAVKLILRRLPFNQFVFWARYGSGSLVLRGHTPQTVSKKPKGYFWIESDILGPDAGGAEPFAVYHDSSRRVFFLNDKVTWDRPNVEYIDYLSGDVKYWEVPQRPWHEMPIEPTKTIDPSRVAKSLRYLANQQLSWTRVPLDKSAATELEGHVGVYVFAVGTGLGGCLDRTVLYVGRTDTDMADRLKHYMRIRAGYDESRPEIAHMFESYNSLGLYFAPTEASDAWRTEEAIYYAASPNYNQIAPTKGAAGDVEHG